MKKQRPIWAIVFGLLLTAYTAYVMLDVFVIKRPMQENAGGINLALFATTVTPTPTKKPSPTPDNGSNPNPGGEVAPEPTETPEVTPTPSWFSDEEIATDTMYKNDHLYIELKEYREHSTDIHVAEIRLTSAQYLLTAFAKDTYGRNILDKPTRIMPSKNAIFAVNGDNYGAREGGYVIRNGFLYRTTGNARMDVMAIMPDGDFYFTHSKYITAQELLEMGAWQAFTFGPVLLDGGEFMVNPKSEVDLCYATNPRTAIGMVEPLHYFVLVADGRTEKSHGLSLYQVADLLKRLGCVKAYNLDGGGSSTMVFRGKVINFPTGDGTYYEREVSDIVYVR